MKQVFIFLTALFLFAGCNKDKEEELPEPQPVNNQKYCNFYAEIFINNASGEDIFMQVAKPVDYPLIKIANNDQYIFKDNAMLLLRTLPIDCPTADGKIKLYFWRWGWDGYLINVFEIDQYRTTLNILITKDSDGYIKMWFPEDQQNRLIKLWI